MYYLTVGAIFRNEADSICEWIEHYKQQGVNHIYLLDDTSVDNSLSLLQPYIQEGLVTCDTIQEPRYLGRQRNMYNKYFLPRLRNREMKWLLVCDMDEYIWSPAFSTLPELLLKVPDSAQIQVNHTIFGSSGHVKQPTSIVGGFTRRSSEQPAVERKNTKYFLQSDYEFSSLNVHHATFVSDDPEFKTMPKFMLLDPEWLIMNHYSCQSREFWRDVKCTRGDADNWWQRTEAYFYETDLNDEEDIRLVQRNQDIIEKIMKSKQPLS